MDVRQGHQDPAAAPLGKGMCTMSPQGLVPALAGITGLAFNQVENHDFALKVLPSRASARRKFSDNESGITLCWPRAETGCFLRPQPSRFDPYFCGSVCSTMEYLGEFIDYKTSLTTYKDPLRGFGGN